MLKVFGNLTHIQKEREKEREGEKSLGCCGGGAGGSKRRIALLFMTPSYCAINRPPTADGDSDCDSAAAAAAIG